ncbi:MAG: hypothetical protein JXB48_04700 [Candidatus Latescibacteria bacterium]|nr:hypothetical protein [Candidatus Latescibacterota bacterium]
MNKLKIINLALILFLSGICFTISAAQNTLVPINEYSEASEYILLNQYRAAADVFDKFIQQNPHEPAGPLLKAAALHYRSIDYDDTSFDEEYKGLLDTAEKLARMKIRADNNDLWARYFYYSARSLKAAWAVTNGKFISGIAQGKSGARGMSRILQDDDEFYDAYLMTGSYRFWKSIATVSVHWLPFFGDNCEEGIAEVETAITHGKLNGPLTNTVLLEMLIVYDLDKAIILGEEMLRQYPSCRLFAWQLGEAYKRAGRFDNAVRVLTDIAGSFSNDSVDDGSGPLRCWWKLAVLCKSLGKKEQCRYYCEKIAKIGKNKSVYNRQRRRIEGAREMLEELKHDS